MLFYVIITFTLIKLFFCLWFSFLTFLSLLSVAVAIDVDAPFGLSKCEFCRAKCALTYRLKYAARATDILYVQVQWANGKSKLLNSWCMSYTLSLETWLSATECVCAVINSAEGCWLCSWFSRWLACCQCGLGSCAGLLLTFGSCNELPITLLTGADLGITSPAAALSFVVPPFVFQFVQQALLIQF